jgi:RND family efflux transporter MFP subunit
MKRILWITQIASVFLLLAAGCSPAPAVTPIPTVSLDSLGAAETSRVKASAMVVPVQESHLSFVISGMVEEVAVEEGDQVQAGQALVQLDMTDLKYDIIAAEAALKSAEFKAQTERQRRKIFNTDTFNFEYASSPAEVILQADSRAEQKRFALEAAKASLAQATLVAPFDGTVIEVNTSPGEYVDPGQAILVLANLDELQIETTDLSELVVAAVEIGQPAAVFVEALDQEFSGKVTAISPIADTIGGDVVFKVTVKLDEQPRDLRWGMSSGVEINVE